MFTTKKLHPRARPVLRNFGAALTAPPPPSRVRDPPAAVIIGEQGKRGVSSISMERKKRKELYSYEYSAFWTNVVTLVFLQD